jgi:excinuclease ABC subunit C
MQKFQTLNLDLKSIPDNPGVYLYANKDGIVIYVGKAKNLKNRVGSYFATTLLHKTKLLMEEASEVMLIKVNSEIEALLLEAKLIKKYMPKYNIALKDDKSNLYIGITREKYPRVLALRKTDLQLENLKYTYGPFTHGIATRKILKMVRRAFPYAQHKPGNRVCIYHQIGLCDPCPSQIELENNPQVKAELIKRYQKNLSNVRKFLNGEFNSLKRSLELQMKQSAKEYNYENAAQLKKQIQYIDLITTYAISPNEYIKDPNLLEDIRTEEKLGLVNVLKPYFNLSQVERIECFDIAHLSGTNPTASMVTFIGGEPDKTYYRHFKVRRKKGDSDVDSMKEVLGRRIKHFDDWGIPDLIIVDGGKPQVSVAQEVIKDIPLVGLAKQFETIVILKNGEFSEIRLQNGPAKNLMQRIRDEAHRFARRLHHKQVSKNLLGI